MEADHAAHKLLLCVNVLTEHGPTSLDMVHPRTSGSVMQATVFLDSGQTEADARGLRNLGQLGQFLLLCWLTLSGVHGQEQILL